MKTKTDLYTKIMLTAVVVLLAAHLIKDINFVTQAQAGELDLSAMKIENASDEGETTFYIYENDNLSGAFGKDRYEDPAYSYLKTEKRKEIYECYIYQERDMPKYIVTTRTGSFMLKK